MLPKWLQLHIADCLISFGILFLLSCQNQATEQKQALLGKVEIYNPTNEVRENALVTLPLDKFKTQQDTFSSYYLKDNHHNEYEFIDQDHDGIDDQLLMLTTLDRHEKRLLELYKTSRLEPNTKQIGINKRTQAGLAVKTGGKWAYTAAVTGNKQHVYNGGRFVNVDSLMVPQQHTDHSFYIQYEGPGWESEYIGYRFYLDWRNAVDIFGKKRNSLVLHHVGLHDFESYHYMDDWGMDILKVGNSLGIGSFGVWHKSRVMRVEDTDSVACVILQNGNLQSSIKTNYYGWKIDSISYNVHSLLTINAKSRYTKQSLTFSKQIPGICTGIVKHDDAKIIQPVNLNNGWSYFATYGNQSLNNDGLGMFIIYNTKDIMEITEDAHSYVLVFKPKDNHLKYYFGAAWAFEENGIKNEEQFVGFLDKTIHEFDNPIRVQFH